MPNIKIKNISDLDINGNDLFKNAERFIAELDYSGESIVGGFSFYS